MSAASRVTSRFTKSAALSVETMEMLRAALASLMGDNADAPMSELSCVLAFLRTLSVVHHTHHWQTRGPQFYADHLMFDRIYTKAQEEIDAIAEKTVGTGERLLVRPLMQVDQLERLMKVVYAFASMDPTADEYVQLSLNAELAFLAFVDLVVESMRARGTMSRGIDNLLAGIQDQHEGHVYLLRQRLAT